MVVKAASSETNNAVTQWFRPWPPTTFRGRLIKRYKRFLADIEVPELGGLVTAHCPNSGSMLGCNEPGSLVLLSQSSNNKRLLPYTWELVQTQKAWVGINTSRPNSIVGHFLKQQAIPELQKHTIFQAEAKVEHTEAFKAILLKNRLISTTAASSRLDWLLQSPEGKSCYLEVKNVTLAQEDHAYFPDAVSTRAQKHLLLLEYLHSLGHQSIMFYFIGRHDCLGFRPAEHIDKNYARLLYRILKQGVLVMAYAVEFSVEGLKLHKAIPIDI